MFRRNHKTYLPLLISGLPVFAIQWLRIAGIPAVPFQTSTLSRQGSTAAGQILVFDARNASGRLDSRMARECGAEVINVADLLPRAEIHPQQGEGVPDEQQAIRLRTHRAAFFDELKLRIESAGGFWLRLADYPFPFQSALCRCQNPEQDLQAFAEHFAIGSDDVNSQNQSETGEKSVSSMRESNACGRPFFISNTQPRSQSADSAQPRPLHADEFPLMWQTTGEQFLRWCHLRSQLSLTAWKTGTTYRIQCSGDVAGFRPTIGLWLGNHVASLPLTEDTMTVREEGILFVQEHRRHAAGFAAGWSVAAGMSNIPIVPAHQSA
ncbi:MAG: hypothetical protein HOL01_21515 [Planctomycetaceae bacterium]|nr:hypothetical protein [Planctomycetaceae bacterium]MBT6485197.1 hypothetical protein [Planctomycetaceae bacterium]MBT6497118.1 hypothetical protein [Planctomycetaceae bacterium]